MNLTTLRQKTAALAKEARQRYPATRPVLEDWRELFEGDERAQLDAFLAQIEPHLGILESGAPDLVSLPDDELDELARWAKRASELEKERSQ